MWDDNRMQMESQVPMDCEACFLPENPGSKDGNSCEPSSSHDHISPQQPVKKQPRQWAAWTRQEEESFFTALRHVGKNFEKITCQVQSKNKDQVRHYYYRLVRRMNKLLGPELCLDAKNSKDTNAAMLRWWSLLEKYSCKASKLHLKPRRFKIFVEALENQLLKDRKKNIRKRLSLGENNCPTSPTTVSNLGRPLSHDSRAAKMVLVDGQNIQKVGAGKGSSVKRNVNNIGTNRTNSKIDSSYLKTAKHRRKTGSSTAAYKRWEKAAIAGVSLVADAAEHLERTVTEKEVERVHKTPDVELSLPVSSQSRFNEYNAQNSMKLKLQLFPIDDCTRKSLEADNHNPHLELTLGTRKKISSVLDHLNRKWGNSNLLSGDLILFPYWAHTENLVGCQKWTKDSLLCAADVYATVGSPPVFRLRYGWFSKDDLESATPQALQSYADVNEKNMNINIMKEHDIESVPTSSPTYDKSGNLSGTCQELLASADNMTSTLVSEDEIVECCRMDTNINGSRYMESTPPVSLVRRETGARADGRQVEDMDDQSTQKDLVLSAGRWAESLTSISVGELLSDSMLNINSNCAESPLPVGSSSLQQIPFSCDSFDAAIAAHINKHQNKIGSQSGIAPHSTSIWDAEETCDAFAFQKSGASCEIGQNETRNASLETCKQIIRTSSSMTYEAIEELAEDKKSSNDDPTYGDPVKTLENSAKDFSGLTDIYWPDSLGPLDLDIPSCRFRTDDLILSDSIGGLNRFLANSLDAFQNCSFFGLDKKESASAVEARQTASISDFKIS
ncbi:TSL-kinase interacting 1 isoform X1 [Olea europaea subsp. europaea]|uniref:TSL-kinase interacting 1 isoform X1 n=1 Tax=Olea europaea subsp. europaea TaxID=158383 RepID=A0A8S0PL39_OLEEU|nr:TSL-kinase interacting 1 isoform X1 [Olea europaea subsp. europaea]